ncbi:MAG: hypothetical protein ACLS49_04580 [Christensenellales bacterium]
MEGINDIDIEDIKISSKEIKVDVDELKNLFQVIQILINENEISHMENWEDIAHYIDYFEKKYFVLSGLRTQEQKWYRLNKQMQDEKNIILPKDEANQVIREIWGNYIQAKSNRELLQRDLKEYKKNYFEFDE